LVGVDTTQLYAKGIVIPGHSGAILLFVVLTFSVAHPSIGVTENEQVGGVITQIVLVKTLVVEQEFLSYKVTV
jgi:hypothetical protein